METLGFMFETLCEIDLKIYAESFDANPYHYQGYKNQGMDALIELTDRNWCAFEIMLGANQIDSAAENFLKIKKQIETEQNDISPAVCYVIYGLTNAAYCRPNGVFVVPITALKD